MRKAVTDNAALVGASAVLTGNVVNVSIFKEVWLERHDIIRKDEYTSDTLVSPGAVRVSTASFELTILLNRIQVRFSPPGYDSARFDVLRVLGGIAELLPHTPYTGLGLNFHYVVAPPVGEDFWKWDRAVFAAPWALAVDQGDGASPRFGSYFSLDALGARLRISIKPTNTFPNVGDFLEGRSKGDDLMLADFNYHHELRDSTEPEDIKTILRGWEDAFEHSARVVCGIS